MSRSPSSSPSPTPISLKTVTVDWDCDRCGAHLMTTSLANMLDHPGLLTAHNPMQCEVCRDIEGGALTALSATNDADLATWTESLAHIPDLDGMEWKTDGLRWSDIIAPVFWAMCGTIVLYAVYGWIR